MVVYIGNTVQMHFEEGDSLSQPQVRHSVSSSQTNLREEPSQNGHHRDQHQSSRTHRPLSRTEWEAETDTTHNRLQALMQLLYLLSRDPAVPNDARFHVTVAQSEIALLSRVMQNSASG